jgi:hypothetical protein
MLQPAGSSLQYKGMPPCLHMSLLVLLEIFTRRTGSSLKRRLLCVVESNGRCWLFDEDGGHCLARESLFPFLSGLGGFPGQQPLPKTMTF